jgi:nucleotide-binding universal stress UspA family protein
MFRKILVGNDGSEGAFRALAAAIDLAKRGGTELHMISVEQLPQFPATIDEVAEEKDTANQHFAKVVDRARELAKRERVKLECHVTAGHVVAAIVDFVKSNGVDLLVIGFMGHSRLYNAVIGGTADRLVDHVPCAVLVVK